MKKAFLLVVLLSLILCSVQAFAGSACEDANDVYTNTESFDGGSGSTINTSPDAYDGDADYSLNK